MSILVEPYIVSFPYEDGMYWRKGAKDGPEAILRELKKLRNYSISAQRSHRYDLEQIISPPQPLSPYSKNESLALMEDSVLRILLDGRAPVVLGGDHSITLPTIRALTKRFGNNSFGILHFDAHSDTFGPVHGYKYHHGAVFKNIVEEGLILPTDIYQFGLRGMAVKEGMIFANTVGINCVLADDLREASCQIRRFCPPDGKLWYLSIDIDVLDPAFAPGTGTPVPGGLSSAEMLSIVHQFKDYALLGMDLVEVAPVYDVAGITSLAAAYILLESLIVASFFKPGEGHLHAPRL